MSEIKGFLDRGATKYFHGRETILAELQKLLADSGKSKGRTREEMCGHGAVSAITTGKGCQPLQGGHGGIAGWNKAGRVLQGA